MVCWLISNATSIVVIALWIRRRFTQSSGWVAAHMTGANLMLICRNIKPASSYTHHRSELPATHWHQKSGGSKGYLRNATRMLHRAVSRRDSQMCLLRFYHSPGQIRVTGSRSNSPAYFFGVSCLLPIYYSWEKNGIVMELILYPKLCTRSKRAMEKIRRRGRKSRLYYPRQPLVDRLAAEMGWSVEKTRKQLLDERNFILNLNKGLLPD